MNQIIKIFSFMVVILFSLPVFAGPLLVCDVPSADQQITDYEVFQDSISLGTVPINVQNIDGVDVVVLYDLNGVTPGQYNFTAKAINVWGSSNPSDPYLSPPGASKPSGTNLIP